MSVFIKPRCQMINKLREIKYEILSDDKCYEGKQ